MRTVGLAIPIRGPEAAGAVSWQGYVKDKDLTAPPGSPAEGDRYIISSPATGLWATHEDDIAEWDGAVWIFQTPAGGWAVWVQDEGEIYVFNGSSWGQESFGPHAPTHKGGGSDEIDAATVSVAGLMASADKDKLDGLIRVIRTTDDIKAILEAAADGSSFWLEDGTHTLSGLITISDKKNITIRGGRGAIIYTTGEALKIEGCEDITIEGFTMDVDVTVAGKAIQIQQLGSGTYLIPTRIAIRGIRFILRSSISGVTGVYVFGGFLEGSVENCQFSGIDANGTCMFFYADGGKEISGLVVRGNHCEGSSVGLTFDASVSHHNLIVGNTFEGTKVVFPGVGGISSGVVFGCNTCRGSAEPLLIGGGTSDLLVVGNTISGSTGKNISVSGGSQISIQGNMIIDATDEGIAVQNADDVSIVGNHIDNNGADGILVSTLAGDGIFIANNRITNNGGYGLEAVIGTGLQVQGNYYNGNTSGPENITVTSYKKGFVKDVNIASTTDATVTTIATIPIPDDTSVWIEANIINRQTNAANRGKFKRGALVYREASGAATKEGATWTPLTIKSVLPAQWDVTITVSGNNALIQVEGLVAQDINWESRHTVEERS